MLMRTDPFRELDRFAQQVLGTAARPAVMPMDAWREGEQFVVDFDLPGIDPDSLDIDIERNVVTVRAERPAVDPNREMLATERPRGVFSRQLVLGENLDTDRIEASYGEGVLDSCTFRWPKRPSRARFPSAAATDTRPSTTTPRSERSSTPDQSAGGSSAKRRAAAHRRRRGRRGSCRVFVRRLLCRPARVSIRHASSRRWLTSSVEVRPRKRCTPLYVWQRH